ncbi:transaldolase [Shumkonia mesophila]|uniref:transaldolase n=1 Tax=Shumkonia mesophila TaxID=2838854 RepID=UPI0029347110|nr:transaldolase [Shumkonia mesophila]
MTSKLADLSRHSVIVADSGDIASIKAFGAQDSTTNPSLILKAASMSNYAALVEDAIAYATGKRTDAEQRIDLAIDRLAVNFGTELLKLVPGYVSTEVDARLSFDAGATVSRALRIIDLFGEAGVDTSRVLIKIAATWEGVKAAAELKKHGIKCNLTLIFSLVQAALCAEAGVFLISPFVGRITDWYKVQGTAISGPDDDPGVGSVREIYKYFKTFGYKTVVMGASFRSTEQVTALAGCDRLTINPTLLEQLRTTEGAVPRRLEPGDIDTSLRRLALDEPHFRWQLNENAMATEKLAEGIRSFAKDTRTLRAMVHGKLAAR